MFPRRASPTVNLLIAAAALLAACGGDAASDEPASPVTTTAAVADSCPVPDTSSAPNTTAVAPTTAATTTAPVVTTATTTTTVSTTAVVTTTAAPARDLAAGDQGADVTAAQEQLRAAGFWLPAVSGEYDEATAHAVTAFEKIHALERDGRLTVDDLEVLGRTERPAPRSSEGRVIEIDIARQVVLVVDDGSTTWILDTSTGARPGWTPTGSFSIYREIDGLRVSALGELYRPKYVVGGVALHGYPEVPPEPASHGCIRLTNEAMDAMWALDLAPIGTPVLIYDGKDPE